MPRKNRTGKARLQRVAIRVEERDEPDWDRFAWALLQYAKLVAADAKQSIKPRQPGSRS